MKVIKIHGNKALLEVNPEFKSCEYIGKDGRPYFPLIITKEQYEKFNLTDTWKYKGMEYGKQYIILKKENLIDIDFQ